MPAEQREMIKRVLEAAAVEQFQSDCVLANFDYAVARERIELCKLRNRFSATVIQLQTASRDEAETVRRMHES